MDFWEWLLYQFGSMEEDVREDGFSDTPRELEENCLPLLLTF